MIKDNNSKILILSIIFLILINSIYTYVFSIDGRDKYTLIYIAINTLISIGLILFLFFKLKKNYEKTQNKLIDKNNFLNKKAQEFETLQNAISHSEIISKTDTNGIITYVNDKFCKISGYTKEELIGKNHNIIRHPDVKDKIFKIMWQTIKNNKVFKGLIKNRRKDGTGYHVDTTIVPILDEDENIKEYLALRHYVEDMINHKKILQSIIKSSKESILIIAKLDGFDELENYYTTEIINKLEEKFLNNSISYFPKNSAFNKAYKLENGEFAFIKPIENSKLFLKENTDMIYKFQENVKLEKYLIDGYSFNPTVLVSYATGKEDIYENARLGLKRLLDTQKNIINATSIVDESRKNAKKNIEMIKIIKTALETNNIISYYQAIYNNKTKKIEKYESLVRLRKETGEVLSPFFFLDIAKKGKFYNEITKTIIENSFKILSKIDEEISINLSFLDIEDDDTRIFIYNKLDKCKKCHRITIELLEDEEAKDFNIIIEFVKRVKQKGIKIAIDDFGSGYSNYVRLLKFQPDLLKIDGSLIKNIDTDSFSRNVVESIQEFAKREKIKTIAEFVHSKEIIDIVNEIGIDYTQGYYIEKPKPL